MKPGDNHPTCNRLLRCTLPAGHSGMCVPIPVISAVMATGVYHATGGEHAESLAGPWEPCGDQPTKQYFRATRWERVS